MSQPSARPPVPAARRGPAPVIVVPLLAARRLVAVAAAGSGDEGPGAPPRSSAATSRVDLGHWRLSATSTVVVGSQISGQVTDVLVTNDTVERGR